jgi:hypothetical protein
MILLSFSHIHEKGSVFAGEWVARSGIAEAPFKKHCVLWTFVSFKKMLRVADMGWCDHCWYAL